MKALNETSWNSVRLQNLAYCVASDGKLNPDLVLFHIAKIRRRPFLLLQHGKLIMGGNLSNYVALHMA